MTLVTEYKGAKLHHVYRGPELDSTVAVDKNLKLLYQGPVCVDHLTNSYRCGEEAHLITYQAKEPEAMFRVQEHNG